MKLRFEASEPAQSHGAMLGRVVSYLFAIFPVPSNLSGNSARLIAGKNRAIF